MAADRSTADDELVALISAAFDRELPPIPARLTDAARDALAWRRVDAELAELLFDSAAADLVGARGGTVARRSFRYAAGDFVVRMHLTTDTMTVMVEPPLSVVCRVVSGDAGPVDHRTDELGELVIDVPSFPIRLELDLPSGTIVTPWVTG